MNRLMLDLVYTTVIYLFMFITVSCGLRSPSSRHLGRSFPRRNLVLRSLVRWPRDSGLFNRQLQPSYFLEPCAEALAKSDNMEVIDETLWKLRLSRYPPQIITVSAFALAV